MFLVLANGRLLLTKNETKTVVAAPAPTIPKVEFNRFRINVYNFEI
jgi:hypothetical protein